MIQVMMMMIMIMMTMMMMTTTTLEISLVCPLQEEHVCCYLTYDSTDVK